MSIIEQHSKNSIAEARLIALSILNKYSQTNQKLDEILEKNYCTIYSLSIEDRRLVNYLVYGVVRWKSRLDSIIETFSNKPIIKIPIKILNIVRMGILQLLFMDRIPDFAAVNTSVNLAKKTTSLSASRYVNAILRITAKTPGILKPQHLLEDSLEDLSHIKAFPKWILTRWEKRFGYDKVSEICDTINLIPEIVIRANTLKIDINNLKIKLQSDREVKKIKTFNSVPNALTISGLSYPINKMDAFSKGLFSVQDGAAQMVSHLLSPEPGEVILDACSGLGGKTTHIAQLMKNQGKIIAIDNIKSKLNKLAKETKRLNIKIVRTKLENLTTKSYLNNYPMFDRILLDAPCSGLGIIRRNPDIKWSSSFEKILKCSKKQSFILENISSLLKPKGTIAYAVCSTEPEETENVITSFLLNNPKFKIKKQSPRGIYTFKKYLGKDGFYRTHLTSKRMDSFFVALLERKY